LIIKVVQGTKQEGLAYEDNG